MNPLGDPKIQRFLDTKEMVVLATIQPDGAPLATAMWFLHDPAALTMISVANLQKVRNLRRDPRVSVVAEAGGGGKPVCRVAVEGRAEGAVAQMLDRPEGFFGKQVIAVGYARVESAHGIEATDEDVTPKLWEGAVALANGYVRWRGGFESPYVPVRFTGREAASGAWKRFVTPPMPAWKARRRRS